ncbi:MAG: translation factor GTPase family protein [Clostridia bacterium]
MKKLSLGILAHVDSGKTTLSEALLFQAGKIRNIGRVDHKNTFLDTHSLEKNRGITIFSKQANFKILETEFNLLDTPGHVDFSAETERTLQVLDYAVLVISGIDGVQSHTETIWTLLARYKVPTFIFINKMDMGTADKEKLLDNIKEKLSQNAVDFIDESRDENLALCSEKMMNSYLKSSDIYDNDICKSIQKREVFPCFFGSALRLEGIENLANSLDKYTIMPDFSKKFGARVFKITWDKQGNRLTHLKITGGSLKLKAVIFGTDRQENDWQEKVNQIRVYSGEKFDSINEAFAGSICAVCGLTNTFAGEGLGFEKAGKTAILEPVLSYSVILPIDIDPHIALRSLRILEQEDPQLHVSWNEITKEINLQLMGAIQLEILQDIIKERFGFDIAFDSGNIVYKETISEEVTGAGHFEPLKHYAEVHLKFEPLSRGSGLIFDNICKHDELAENWQRLILSHLSEKTHTGVLTNSAITDLKITVTHGISHLKHTEGGDFREATYRAIRHALLKAKSVLLEPFYNFKIEVPQENLGRVLTDIDILGGKYGSPETYLDSSVIKGTIPVSAIRDYSKQLMSFTHGKGSISLNFSGYDICRNSEQVIKEIGYDAESDTENTGHSVFCSHGSGYLVKWQDADSYMHYKEEKKKTSQENISFSRRQEITDISEKELLAIFEQTYGAIKNDPRIGFEQKKRPVRKSEVKTKVAPMPQGPEYLLVDGYNIIFAWESLKELSKTNLESARNKLMDMLCNYRAYHNCNLILVFDAYKVKGNRGSVENYHNISVVYTKEAETADMYIEKVTHDIGKKHRVRVATSDGLQQMIIFGHGASRISALAFEQDVKEAEKSIREILSTMET